MSASDEDNLKLPDFNNEVFAFGLERQMLAIIREFWVQGSYVCGTPLAITFVLTTSHSFNAEYIDTNTLNDARTAAAL
jgi:hypothetical protein